MSNIEMLVGSVNDKVDISGSYDGVTRCACLVRRGSKMNVICTGNSDGSIALRSEDAKKYIQLENDHSACVNCIAIDNSAIWVGFSNGLLNIYDVHTNNLLGKRKETQGGVLCIVYNPNLDNIFTSGHGWEILKWDCKEHSKIGGANLSGHTNAVRSLVTETHYLYSSSDDSTVRCWNIGDSNGSLVWTSVLGNQRARCIVLDGDHLVCSIEKGGIQILSKYEGNHLRNVDIGTNKPGLIMKEVDDNDIWVADSSGTVTVWERNFLAKQIVITTDKKTLVSSMVPLSQEFKIQFFARQEGKASSDLLPTLVGMRLGAPYSDDRCGTLIVDTCRQYFHVVSVLAEVQQANLTLDAAVLRKWGKLSGLLHKQAMARLLHVFYIQLLNFARKRTAYREKILCFYKNSLQVRRAKIYYSALLRNLQFRPLSMSSTVPEKIARNLQVYHFYRKMYEMSKMEHIPV